MEVTESQRQSKWLKIKGWGWGARVNSLEENQECPRILGASCNSF